MTSIPLRNGGRQLLPEGFTLQFFCEILFSTRASAFAELVYMLAFIPCSTRGIMPFCDDTAQIEVRLFCHNKSICIQSETVFKVVKMLLL